MRLYQRRVLKDKWQRRLRVATETRNAILWDILPDQRLCRVKVVGAPDTLIIAHYPENWRKTPEWLKPGNPVLLIHREGERGKIEIAGHGQVRPADAGLPDAVAGEDAILEGCQVIAPPNGSWYKVLIKTGWYRINGVVYPLGPILMSDSTVYTMGMGGLMMEIADCKALNSPPPEGYLRYDLFVVGTDGVVDYVPGDNFTETIRWPVVDADHVILGNVLVYEGMTEVTSSDINRIYIPPVYEPPPDAPDPPESPPDDFPDEPPDEPTPPTETPYPADMYVSANRVSLAWGVATSDISCRISDQFGRAIYKSGNGWAVKATLGHGNGYISTGGRESYFYVPPGQFPSNPAYITGYSGPDSRYVYFTYRRPMLVTDSSVHIQFILVGDREIEEWLWIQCYDQYGQGI